MIPPRSSCGNMAHAGLLRAGVHSHPIAAEAKAIAIGLSRAILVALTDQDQAAIDGANRC